MGRRKRKTLKRLFLPRTFLAFFALVAFLVEREGHGVPLTLMIDPGHGGEDVGGVASDGITEKELTLEWALQLRDRLGRESDFSVMLTRDQDVSMTFDQRAIKTNQSKAHLYVGFHMNQAPAVSLTGGMVRIYKPSVLIKRTGAANLVWWAQAQAAWAPKSRLAAADFAQELSRVGPVSLKEGPWIDLRSLSLPALAIEMGYLSAPEEVARIRNSGWRQEALEAMVVALRAVRLRMGL